MKLDNLFPTPIATFDLGRELTKKELEFIMTQERITTSVNQKSVNNYLLDNPILKNLKKTIEECLNIYYKDVYNFKTDNAQVYVTQSWSNYASKGQRHHRHAHPNSFFSGVLYINVDLNDLISFTNPNKFHFYNDIDRFNQYNVESVVYHVKPNTIILFPSTLEHEVPPTTVEHDRVSLAFNSFIKGTMGTSLSLTELILK